MTDYIRRLVSGNKERFKDINLDVELDLVYVTDQVIIMGYPASGMEGLYRNRREDVKKFLEHRHGKNYWIFNFCPIRENSYNPEFFDGRVSRYPFPDHHAPPLAIMPLVAREMREWLNGSPERVAVLHCKAGKGRSGTMACTYLLSQDEEASPPRLERSYNSHQWAKVRTEGVIEVIPTDDAELAEPMSPETPSALASGETTPNSTAVPKPKSFGDSLKGVLDLHTSRRMKTASEPGKTVKQGVSIPSQRRWLYYWSLLLAHDAPSHLWPLPNGDATSTPTLASTTSKSSSTTNPKVRLTEITLRMRESSGMKLNLVRAANLVLERASKKSLPSQDSHLWISLARYDDEFVKLLERWEVHTRDRATNHMGRREKGANHKELFEDGKWDTGKMVRSFARMGPLGENAITKVEDDKDGKIITYKMTPLTEGNLEALREDVGKDTPEPSDIPSSETNSLFDATQAINNSGNGIVLDAGREVRVKLYMGQVFMGWIWFIPTFHMSPNTTAAARTSTKFLLTRKEVDFPLGVGSSIIDVEIAMEWVDEAEAAVVQPESLPSPSSNENDMEPAGLAATIQAATAGEVGVGVEAKQAAED